MQDTIRWCEPAILFLDTTGGVNQYNFPLYAIVVQDNDHHIAGPIAYMIASDETSGPIIRLLSAIHAANPVLNPSLYIVDKYDAEIFAIPTFFG